MRARSLTLRRSGALLLFAALALPFPVAGAAPGDNRPTPLPARPTTNNPALAREMTQAADQLRSDLPIQVDEITRVVGIRAEGTEFVYDLEITEAIPPDQIETARTVMQNQNQTNMCANPDVNTFIGRGGSMNHRYVDTAGKRFQTRVVRC